MKQRITYFQLIVLYWLLGSGIALAGPTCPTLLGNEQAAELLAKGKVVIVIRHMEDVYQEIKKNCEEPSRSLTPEGSDHARQIGAVISELNIPLAAVISSPFCRPLQTAELIAPDSISVNNGLALGTTSSFLHDFLRTSHPPGNVILVTHGTNMDNIMINGKQVVDGYSTSGLAAFFVPDANGPKLLGCLAPKDWNKLFNRLIRQRPTN